jgi:hypothetical protein
MRRETHQNPASTRDLDKENKLVPLLKKVSVNDKSYQQEKENKSNKDSKDALMRKITKIEGLNSYLPILPELTRPSKRNSIETNENWSDFNRLQLNSQSANNTKLAIIE